MENDDNKSKQDFDTETVNDESFDGAKILRKLFRYRHGSITDSVRKKYAYFLKELSGDDNNSDYCSSSITISNDDVNEQKATAEPKEINVAQFDVWSVDEFLEKLNSDDRMMNVFRGLLNEPKITVKQVHDRNEHYTEKSEKFYKLFCEFFITKHVCQLKDIPCFDNFCNELLAVFPILLHTNYEASQQLQLEIVDHLDKSLLDEVNAYLAYCYLRQDDILREVKHLLFLIAESEIQYGKLNALLEANFLVLDRNRYIRLLKRYMLFYAYCMDNGKYTIFYDSNENCHSDLQEMVESYRLYECYRYDVMDLRHVVLAVTLFHYQLLCSSDDDDVNGRNDNELLSVANITRLFRKTWLERIACYFDRFKNDIDNVTIHPVSNIKKFLSDCRNEQEQVTVDDCYLQADALLLVNDTLLDVVYSMNSKNSIGDFSKLILGATMMTQKCNKLIIYNAFLGEETSMDMIENIDKLMPFIRKCKVFFSGKPTVTEARAN